jgi:Ca-activated chloride channel family protein
MRVVNSQVAQGATATGDALELALQLLGRESAPTRTASDPRPARRTPAAVVLLSDGAANAGRYDPVTVAGEAAARRIPIYTVALGSTDATIPNPNGFGPPVPVPPDPELLERIARASHGRTFSARDAGHLTSIYQRLGAQLGSVRRSRDVTAAFALAGAALLLGAGLTALRWEGRLP